MYACVQKWIAVLETSWRMWLETVETLRKNSIITIIITSIITTTTTMMISLSSRWIMLMTTRRRCYRRPITFHHPIRLIRLTFCPVSFCPLLTINHLSCNHRPITRCENQNITLLSLNSLNITFGVDISSLCKNLSKLNQSFVRDDNL